MTEPTCVFCAIGAGTAPAAIVWQDRDHVAFLDRAPIAPGHLLVIPRRHEPDLFALPAAAYNALLARVRRLAGPLRTCLGVVPRIGVAVEGFSVPHVHIHLVPLTQAGDLDPCRQRVQEPAALQALAEQLRRELRALGVTDPGDRTV